MHLIIVCFTGKSYSYWWWAITFCSSCQLLMVSIQIKENIKGGGKSMGYHSCNGPFHERKTFSLSPSPVSMVVPWTYVLRTIVIWATRSFLMVHNSLEWLLFSLHPHQHQHRHQKLVSEPSGSDDQPQHMTCIALYLALFFSWVVVGYCFFGALET